MKITTKTIDLRFEHPSLDTKQRESWVWVSSPLYAKGYFVDYKGTQFFVRKSQTVWILHEKWTGRQISPGGYKTRKDCIISELEYIESQGSIIEFGRRMAKANFKKLN